MSLSALQRFVDGRHADALRATRASAARAVPGDRCEMCAQSLAPVHSHVVHVETRRLTCSCRACYLLFAQQGAAQGKLRAVPERYRRDPDLHLDDATWTRLQIPVRTAFFFRNSQLERFVAFYPSPAGATESLLDLQAWEDIVTASPSLNELEPDVEALLVHGPRGAAFQCFLVPIDACYELVGRVRRTWRGFDGGEQAWQDIDSFFAAVAERSQP